MARPDTPRRSVALVACLLFGGFAAPGRADETTHEAYEEVQPKIEEVAAIHHGDPEWTRFHEVTAEFTAMVLGFHYDRRLSFKIRNGEPLYWAAQLMEPDSTRLIPVNISHSGTLRDPHLKRYIKGLGVRNRAAERGAKFLFVDGSLDYFSTFNAIRNAGFRSETLERYQPIDHAAVVGTATQPELSHFSSLLRFAGPALFEGDETTFLQNYQGWRGHFASNWERSAIIPHFTGNTDHYEKRGHRWMAMASRDRNVPSWDVKFSDLPAEKQRAIHFMEDLKAHFTSEEGRRGFTERKAMWRTMRENADAGDWNALADQLAAQHEQDPHRGEAVARDVLGLLHRGFAKQRPDFAAEDALRARSPMPVHPWLVAKLRAAAPRR